jgi:predicted DCC family thiol-disulfide oxidoreductase YuxK
MQKVAVMPPKPLMIYDGDCNFCKLWIRRWRQITGDAVDYLPSQDPQVAKRFPEIPSEEFQRSVQLVEPDGNVFSGAHAVFLSLAKNPRWQSPLRWHKKSRAFAKISEAAYRFVAKHRSFFSRLSRTPP